MPVPRLSVSPPSMSIALCGFAPYSLELNLALTMIRALPSETKAAKLICRTAISICNCKWRDRQAERERERDVRGGCVLLVAG